MLFGLAIEKSNIEADLIQIELPGSVLILSGHKSETGATCSAYNLNVSQLPFSYYLRRMVFVSIVRSSWTCPRTG